MIKNFFSKQILVEKWKKYELNPVLGNINTDTVFDPYIIKDKDDFFKMYVSWRKYGTIAISISKDGINWSNLKKVLDKGKSGSWENIVNRACILYKKGIYHMWYTGQNDGISKIGYARSQDGFNYKKLGNPILVPEYIFEKKSVMSPNVIYDEEEKLYKMWYSAGETYEPDVIAYATSEDGINWKKYKNNPIFTRNKKPFSLDSFKVGVCDIHKISYNKYLMFYIGYSDLHTARIFVAESMDGIKNWKRSSNAIIYPSKKGFDSHACYKPSAFYDKKNKRWMLWYNGRFKEKEFIGLATYNEYKIFKY